MTKRVGYQGVPGAYSSIAAREAFPRLPSVGFPTFDETVAALQGGDVAYALLPIENSTSGRVADMHHLLPGSGLTIIGEHFLPIHHCLIGLKGVSRDDIRHIYSHREALNQCRNYIRSLGAEAVPYGDTAAAVDHIANLEDPHVAALASKLAAERSEKVRIMERDVEDCSDNVTRFLVLTKGGSVRPPRTGDNLTSVVFETRDVPAALFKSLAGFATAGTNIIKLESFVPMAAHTHASFYLEFEGTPDTPPQRIALEELGHYTRSVTILGCYPKSPYRGRFEAQVDKKRYSRRNP